MQNILHKNTHFYLTLHKNATILTVSNPLKQKMIEVIFHV